MKKVSLFWVCVFIYLNTYAQIDGPFSGGTFSNVALTGSSQSWVNTGNVAASDNVYATFGNLSNPAGTHTDYLQVTNFGFNVPPAATITGIVVEIERSDPSGRTADYSIRIIKNGVIGTADRSGGAAYPLSDGYQTYGTAGDFWGETWSAAEINNSSFGIAIAAQRSVSGGTTANARIDHVRISVFYDLIVTPLKLISFTGVKQDKGVDLKWMTSEEVNMDYYTIERSVNGRDFVSIGTVSSNNQLFQVSYLYTDNNPLNGISYYRLKMVGIAGEVRYSKIVSLQISNGNRISIYPTLFQYGQNLTITNPSNEQLKIEFFTVSGQLVLKVITTTNILSTRELQPRSGILLYKIYQKNGLLAGSGKLLIQ